MKHLRMLIVVLAFGPACAAADWSDDGTLVKDMVMLDKNYVSALLLSDEGDLDRAEKAMARLVPSWDKFRSKWNGIVNDEWRTGFARVDQLVAEAATEMSTRKDLERVHQSLNEVRRIFMRLRKEEGIAYFVDFFTDFEIAMDAVWWSVVHNKHLMMNTDELDNAENLLLVATGYWKVITGTPLDKIVYRIDHYSMGEVALYKNEVARLLAELIADLPTSERVDLAGRVDVLMTYFRSFFKLFGEYGGLK